MSEIALNSSNNWLKPRAASSEKGRKRLVHILEVAREIFALEGYSNFTLRRIASESGIHLASLQHYFATKEDLLGALMESTGDYHERVLQDIMDKPASTADERFVSFIRHQLSEHQNIQTCGLFYQIWSLAPMHSFARKLMDQMYANYRGQLSQLMADMRPELDGDELQQRATLIVAMMEGMMLFIGGKKKTSKHFKNLGNKAEDLALQIAHN